MNGAGLELLTAAQMASVDAAVISRGTSGLELMERAGDAVALAAGRMSEDAGSIDILCGPGNNGGDGFVAARLLRQSGYRVRVFCTVPVGDLTADAGVMAEQWEGETLPFAAFVPVDGTVVIDAIFGAGLSRPVAGQIAKTVQAVNDSGCSVLSVDMPSGVDGSTGASLGVAISATETVTFFRRKPGHLIYPGRRLCGVVSCVEIGMPDGVMSAIDFVPGQWTNVPELWRDVFPSPQVHDHKYSRGHAVVVSGPAHMTGAARLGARAALRVGAGAVTMASRPSAMQVNGNQLTAIMLARIADASALTDLLGDTRKKAALIGPGYGIGTGTAEMAGAVMTSEVHAVLDADALTSFSETPNDLFSLIGGRRPSWSTVLTPHEGEFARLFPDIGGGRLDRARRAAERSGAIVVLKGVDTVIATTDGRAVINENAPSTLATAGSGDVLAGLVTGLLAQGMPAFEAACAAVWLHGAAASTFGPGLIAEDLPEMVPRVLARLAAGNGRSSS